MELDLTGKTLFLTGGSGGIGSAIREAFVECGAKVIAPTSKEMNLLYEEAVNEYLDNMKDIPDMIVYAAGFNELAGICDVTYEVFDRAFRVNVFSFMTIMNRLVPNMKSRGFGRIIGVSSLYGIVSKEKRVPYSSSKHAMTGLIKSTALELAENGILVNGIAPGYVMTEMTKKNLSWDEIIEYEKIIPTHRFQAASEIANLCVFLCSDLNKSITGQIIPVDGGFLCR